MKNINPFYLVVLAIDYEGIQNEMYLFDSLEKATSKKNELDSDEDKSSDWDYIIKEINCD